MKCTYLVHFFNLAHNAVSRFCFSNISHFVLCGITWRYGLLMWYLSSVSIIHVVVYIIHAVVAYEDIYGHDWIHQYQIFGFIDILLAFLAGCIGCSYLWQLFTWLQSFNESLVWAPLNWAFHLIVLWLNFAVLIHWWPNFLFIYHLFNGFSTYFSNFNLWDCWCCSLIMLTIDNIPCQHWAKYQCQDTF